MSSLAEIRKAIEKLAPKERAELRQWLDAQDIEESPEFLAAVDKGIWSAENEPKSSLEVVMNCLTIGKFDGVVLIIFIRTVKAWITTVRLALLGKLSQFSNDLRIKIC